MNNRKLSLLLVVLSLGLWGISKFTSNDNTQSFETDLITIDTAQVTIIQIEPADGKKAAITLQRSTNDQWLATKETVTTIANKNAIDAVLRHVQLIKTKEVAAKKKEKWRTYEVDKKTGTRIKVYTESNLLEEFLVGAYQFNKSTNEESSFVRIKGEEEVYTIDGTLSKDLRQSFDAYRNERLMLINKEAITELVLTNENGVVQNFQKINDLWTKDSIAMETTSISNYLSSIENVSSPNFVDDIDPITYAIPKYRTLILAGKNMLQPVTITCYRDEAKNPPYIFHSSENMESYFSSEETDLFRKVFGILEEL